MAPGSSDTAGSPEGAGPAALCPAPPADPGDSTFTRGFPGSCLCGKEPDQESPRPQAARVSSLRTRRGTAGALSSAVTFRELAVVHTPLRATGDVQRADGAGEPLGGTCFPQRRQLLGDGGPADRVACGGADRAPLTTALPGRRCGPAASSPQHPALGPELSALTGPSVPRG